MKSSVAIYRIRFLTSQTQPLTHTWNMYSFQEDAQDVGRVITFITILILFRSNLIHCESAILQISCKIGCTRVEHLGLILFMKIKRTHSVLKLFKMRIKRYYII